MLIEGSSKPFTQAKTVYFLNLNGVRAIAIAIVVVAHIELDKRSFHLVPLNLVTRVSLLGKLGVIVFFALSGFLVTYLLLEEKKVCAKINFTKFYLRRLLRIAPLYLVVILVGFFVYPKSNNLTGFFCSLLFLPNLAFTLRLLPSLIDPVWSIGTEMQFYFFHAHFFRIKKINHLLIALISFLILFTLFFNLVKHYQYGHPVLIIIRSFYYYVRFDYLSIGAIMAVLFYKYNYRLFNRKSQKAFGLIFTKTSQVLLLILLFLFSYLYLGTDILAAATITTLLVSLLIVNLCSAKTSIYSLNNEVFIFIGEISYSIYLLHKFVVHFVIWCYTACLPGQGLVVENLIIYLCSLLLSVGVATLSYYGIERYFLRLKARFAKVPDKKPL